MVRVLLALFLGSLAVTFLVGSLAMTEKSRIVFDFRVLSVQVVSLFFCLFRGAQTVADEAKHATLHLLRSKRLDSWYILLGKFFGLAIFLVGIYLVWGFGLRCVWELQGLHFNVQLVFFAWILSFSKDLVLLAVVLLLASAASPFVTMFTSLCIYMISHSSQFLHWYSQQTETDPITTAVISLVYYIFPSFDRWSLTDTVVYQLPFLLQKEGFLLILETIFYVIAFLIFATIIFARKRKYGLVKK